MRNLTTAVSATVTAVLIGLLIANVASAARAAEIAQTKEQQLAAVQDSYNQNDLNTQLEAYRTRYAEAYAQLATAYQTLSARDAEYRAALDQAKAASDQLAGTNASLNAQLNAAYQALRDAQAMVTSLQASGGGGAPNVSPRVTTTQRPTATSRPPDD